MGTGSTLLRNLVLIAGFLSGLATLPAQAQQTLQQPRTLQLNRTETQFPEFAITAKPGAVILKPGRTDANIRALTIKRRVSVASLRARPVLALGNDRADFSPVLNNSQALMNIGSRLQRMPNLVRMIGQNTEILEVSQGLIMRQTLHYQIKTGACTNSNKRQRLAQNGIQCFTKMNTSVRASAFSNSNNPRYIADPRLRAQALSASRQNAQQEQVKIREGIQTFRAMMRNPAQRAKVVAELGAAETTRLSGLNDADLEAEIINAAEFKIEDVMFVPNLGLISKFKPVQPKFNRYKMTRTEPVEIEHALKPTVLLTGFTIGREKEWSRSVSITIKACLVGCKRTYYLKLHAGFGYGFGLRFPIQTGGLYAYEKVGNRETATIAPVFKPINGSEQDYQAAGLRQDKLFEGKELVAELNAYAGMNYKVPFHSGGVSFDVGFDLTDHLPAPLVHGQFTPPAPGDQRLSAIEKVFDSPDLIGGRANFGVAGAKILPAVKLGLTSDQLLVKLKDNISGIETEMRNSGQTYSLAVNPQNHSSNFTIGYPEYDLDFKVTPGLAARLFVDVAVWSKNWDWPVWFPQVAVTLPPGGGHFSCHEQTVCARDYVYSPTLTQDQPGPIAGPTDQLEKEVYDWHLAFNKKWIDKCPYLPLHFCEVALRGVAQMTGNQMQSEMQKAGYPSLDAATIMIRRAVAANKKAETIVLETKIASVDYYGKSLLEVYLPFWSKDCADQLCRTRIQGLGDAYLQALMARQKASPKLDRKEVVFLENTQGNWAARAKAEVQASHLRSKRFRRIIRLR
jgi:stress response protein YsnF